MGLLVDGVWRDQWYDTASNDGRFVRTQAVFRDWVAPDTELAPKPGRYHLYVADACPWCHRVVLARAVFGLEHALTVHRVAPLMLDEGWVFDAPEPLFGYTHAHQLYTRAVPDYTGRVTVPILWDTQTDRLVNNESSDILRMLDDAFRPLHTREAPRWYPEAHRDAIDAVNAWVYDDINNGVYKAGFATTQQAYDEAVSALFAALDRAEALLDGRDWLVAEHPTEADWRLFATLIRFDSVYHTHFKCNVRRIQDYPNLQRLTERLYRWPHVAETVRMPQIKQHYFGSHRTINPHGIVPSGPDLAFLTR